MENTKVIKLSSGCFYASESSIKKFGLQFFERLNTYEVNKSNQGDRMQKINHDDFIDRTLYYYKNVIILEVKNSMSLPCLNELVQIQDTIYSIDQIINDVSKSQTHVFLNNHRCRPDPGYKFDFNEFCEQHQTKIA